MANKHHIQKINLTATTIEVNGVAIGASIQINVAESVEYYWIKGNATLLNPLAITTIGTLSSETVIKIMYDATMDLNGSTITILGYSIPAVFQAKQMYIFAKYDADTSGWDIVVMPDFAEVGFINENKIETELAKASRFITRSAAGVVESVKAIPTGDVIGTSDTQTLTNKSLIDETTYFKDNVDNTKEMKFQLSAITAGQTRVITVLDEDLILVGRTNTQTLTNKTLTTPIFTLPEINDTSADHKYLVRVSELIANRTITLPLLTGNDVFVFEAHSQALTNKTINADSNSISNIEATDCKTSFRTELITVTVNLESAHTVYVTIPYDCEVSASLGVISSTPTVAPTVTDGEIMIEDNGGNNMLASNIIHTVGDAHLRKTATATMNRTINAFTDLRIEVKSPSTTGLVVVSIPVIRT